MAGGYSHKPPGTDGLAGLVKDIQAQIAAIRSGAGIRSAVIRDSQLIFTTADGEGIGTFGTFPLSSLDDDLNRTTDIAKGALFEAGDGQNLLLAVQYESGSTEAQLGGDIVLIRASEYGDFVSEGDLRVSAGGPTGTLYLSGEAGDTRVSTTTTASAANVYKDPISGRLYRSTSALKYKTDIADAEVDPADVLALVGRTWVDKNKIDNPEQHPNLRRDVGFIADELDQHPSLRQFVVYDEDGEPDSIEYDRLAVALLAVIKWLTARVDRIEAENAELRKQVADLAARVTRLESGGK